MQPTRIGLLLVFAYTCSLCNAVPLGEVAEPVAETRIIVPSELPPKHFATPKEKTENTSSDMDSNPLNFLRIPEGFPQNMSSPMQPSILAIDGNKQIPIYITIPIYVYPSYAAQPGAPNEAVIKPSRRNELIQPKEEKVSVSLNSEDVKIALKELLMDTFKPATRESADRKKRVNNKKLRKIYRN